MMAQAAVRAHAQASKPGLTNAILVKKSDLDESHSHPRFCTNEAEASRPGIPEGFRALVKRPDRDYDQESERGMTMLKPVRRDGLIPPSFHN